MRNQPITRVRVKMGVELDRTRARRKEWETGRGEKALLLTREDIAKEKAVVLGAAQLGEVRPSTGRGGRKDLRHSGEGKGTDCVILSLACPRTLGSPGGVVGILAPKAEKEGEEVSHTSPPS